MKLNERKSVQDGAMELLERMVSIAPVYYSLGNHEWACDDIYRQGVSATGAVLLENEWILFRKLWIGGQNSAKCMEKEYNSAVVIGSCKQPDTDWLKRDDPDGYKILICYHPEYYDIVKDVADLIISDHTHGGQW